jgi:hypothetical protein
MEGLPKSHDTAGKHDCHGAESFEFVVYRDVVTVTLLVPRTSWCHGHCTHLTPVSVLCTSVHLWQTAFRPHDRDTSACHPGPRHRDLCRNATYAGRHGQTGHAHRNFNRKSVRRRRCTAALGRLSALWAGCQASSAFRRQIDSSSQRPMARVHMRNRRPCCHLAVIVST